MGQELPRTATPLKPPAMAQAFCAAARAEGYEPDGAALPILLGIIGIENANGAAILHHNWGNIAAFEGWTGDYWRHPKPQAGQPLFFRAYPSHEAGARDWWRHILRRWPRVVAAAARNRPDLAVAELYRSDPPRQYPYVTSGSPRVYADAVRKFAQQYRRDRVFDACSPRMDWFPPAVAAAAAVALVAIEVTR